jgi:hypothetical protein
MQAFFGRLDANGDGYVDASELNALRQRMASGATGGGPP